MSLRIWRYRNPYYYYYYYYIFLKSAISSKKLASKVFHLFI